MDETPKGKQFWPVKKTGLSDELSAPKVYSPEDEDGMAAPKGNQFWKARTKHGRDKIFESDEILWDACTEYFEWVDANPIWEMKPHAYEGEIVYSNTPRLRPYTIDGLCIFLNISVQTWANYRKDQDFLEVITRAERVVYTQKFEGAATNQLNANIIARDLGLKEGIDHSTSEPLQKITVEIVEAKDGKPVQADTKGKQKGTK